MNEQWSKNFMKKLGVCMSDNQKALFVIESVILLSPMLLIIAIIVLFSITFILDGVAEAAVILYIACAFFILLTLLPNLFFYFLRNKLDLRIETFLYGIGFLSNIVSGFVVLLFLGSLLICLY